MKLALILVLLAAGIAQPVAAQASPLLDVGIQSNLPNGIVISVFVTQAPPMTQYTVYYVVGNPFLNPNALQTIAPLFSSVTGATGADAVLIPIQVSPNIVLQTPEVWAAAVFTPVVGPPVVSDPIGFELSSNPGVPRHTGLVLYRTTCLLYVVMFVPPGSLVELKVDGVVVDSQYSSGGGWVTFTRIQCLFPTDSVTVFVNGAQEGATVHGGP